MQRSSANLIFPCCPAPAAERSVIKSEGSHDNAKEGTVTIRQPSTISLSDFDKLLHKLTKETNILAGMYQVQLQHPSKGEAISRIYQMQEAKYTSNLEFNKILQPVMAMSDRQMVGVPWDFRQSQHTRRFNSDPPLPEDTVLSQTWPSYARTSPPPPNELQWAPPAVTRHEGAAVSPQQGLSDQSLSRELISVQVQVTQPPQSDPQKLCRQCGSLVHQLKHHPNPNTPEGYLRGCVHCNSLYHRLTTCPHRDMFADNEWYYLRECRTGLCPVEDFRDFREIHRLDADGRLEYSVEMHLPLTPRPAVGKEYGKESRFQHPL
ncbi:hypothetical protein WAI453_003617 [Rhynchosporium graminicola]